MFMAILHCCSDIITYTCTILFKNTEHTNWILRTAMQRNVATYNTSGTPLSSFSVQGTKTLGTIPDHRPTKTMPCCIKMPQPPHRIPTQFQTYTILPGYQMYHFSILNGTMACILMKSLRIMDVTPPVLDSNSVVKYQEFIWTIQ